MGLRARVRARTKGVLVQSYGPELRVVCVFLCEYN